MTIDVGFKLNDMFLLKIDMFTDKIDMFSNKVDMFSKNMSPVAFLISDKGVIDSTLLDYEKSSQTFLIPNSR